MTLPLRRNPEGGTGHSSSSTSSSSAGKGATGKSSAKGGGPKGSAHRNGDKDDCEDGKQECNDDDGCKDECGSGWYCYFKDKDDDEGICTAPESNGGMRSGLRPPFSGMGGGRG
jgi:hypothetical protein